MKGKHWAILGGMCVAVATQLGSVQHWHEVMSPLFISGLLMQVGLLFGALFSEKPESSK